MSKDTSYEVERDTPLAIWTNFSHYDFLNSKLSVLFSFLASQELTRYANTQLHFELIGEHGTNKESLAAVIVPSSLTLHPSGHEVACIARNFIDLNSQHCFDQHGFVVHVYHGSLATPYVVYELQVTPSGEVNIRMEEFCFGHKWEWTKVAQLSKATLTSQRTLELIYLDWMREFEILASLAVSFIYKRNSKELHHGIK